MQDVYTKGQAPREPSENSATIPTGQSPTGSLSRYGLLYLPSRHSVPAFVEIMPEGREHCSSGVLPAELWRGPQAWHGDGLTQENPPRGSVE